jgi:alpha-soluble NSF attachment protein
MGDAKTKGEELMKSAEKKIGKFFDFGGTKYEEAQELFTKAGAQFKIAKEWSMAGEAYMRAADMAMKMKAPSEACAAYTEAANTYKKSNLEKAEMCMNQAIQLNIDNNRLNAAARLEKDMAEMFESEGSLEGALIHYKKAHDYFFAEDQPNLALGCMQKMAMINGQLDRFESAYRIFEDIGHKAINGPMKHQAKEAFFKATLCRMALVTNDNRTETSAVAREAFENYAAADIYFRGTREFEFCEAALEALETEDLEGFEDAVGVLNEMKMLDDWKAHILVVVKRSFDSLC